MSNPEKSLGIDELLAFRASAGSGKTFSLALRYLTLLFAGAQAGEILALTFTRKAALEMKTRIHEALLGLLEEKNRYFEPLLQESKMDAEFIRERHSEVCARFLAGDLKIMTIDAFLHHVVKKFCWYAGIPYDFEISSLDSGALMEEFLSELSPFAYSRLLELCLREDKTLEGAFSLLKNLAQRRSEFAPDYMPPLKDSDSQSLMKCAENIKRRVRESDGASSRALNAVEFSNPSELLERGKTWLAKDSLTEYSYFKKLNLSDLDEDFRVLKGHLKDYFCAKESHLLRELLSLLEHFRASLWKIIKKEKRLGFDEIAQGAYELLGEGIIEREFLYFRLDSRITHLLIDEFQDTSLLQYRILEPLIAEIKSGISRKLHRSFFYVGDPKQSIYRFRGSHAELFEWVARDMKVRDLPYNYRSAGEIVKFVNRVFTPLYENYYAQEPKNAGGYVKVRADEEPLSGLKAEMQRLLSAGVNADDVAILVFNNDDVLSVAEFLKSEFSAIRIVTETSAKLIRQREVRALLRALNYALFGKEVDGVSFLAMVGEQGKKGGNPTPQINDAQAPKSPCKEGFYLEVLDFLRQNSGRKSSELIMEIMERYALASASARRFLEISLEHADLGEFLEYCKKLEEPLSTEELSGVRVLTIHKSKGLEFPYVFVLDRLSRGSNRSDTIFYDYAGIKLNEVFYHLKGRENFDPAYANALKREENLKQKDTLNMLYVALTRAKSGLFVLLKEQNSAMAMLGVSAQESGNLSVESPRKSELAKESSINDLDGQEDLSLWIANLGRQSDFLKKERAIPVGESADLMAGEAFHMALEHYIGFCAKEVQIEALLANRYGYFLEAHRLKQIVKHAREIVEGELLGAILSKGRVKCEIPFLEKGKMRRIDLLVECEEEMIVVDYKSTLGAQERYKEQVESYKKFVFERTQKPTRGYLLAYKDRAYLLEV